MNNFKYFMKNNKEFKHKQWRVSSMVELRLPLNSSAQSPVQILVGAEISNAFENSKKQTMIRLKIDCNPMCDWEYPSIKLRVFRVLIMQHWQLRVLLRPKPKLDDQTGWICT